MKCFIALLVLVLSSFLLAKAQEEQQSIVAIGDANVTTFDTRIIGGLPAKPGQFPWQVAMNIRNPEREKFCSGSLIGPTWVLTAAHCIIKNTQVITMYFGGITLNRLEKGRETAITKKTIILHPHFHPVKLYHDIALVRLNCRIEYTPRIQPIALANEGEYVGGGVSVTLSGWGKTSDHSGFSNTLRYVRLTTITNRRCSRVYGPSTVIQETLCTSSSSRGAACVGDGGGAAVMYKNNVPIQVAISYFVAQRGCSLGFPNGFVRVSPYRKWIRQQTGI